MRPLLVAAAAALALLVAFASTAAAAPVVVESCHAADGTPLSTGALSLRTHKLARGGGDRCSATDGALLVQVKPGARARRGAYVEARFSAPSRTTVTRAEIARRVSLGPGYAYRLYALVGASRRATAVESCSGASCASLAATFSAALPTGTRSLALRVVCTSRRCARPTSAAPAVVSITRSAVTVEDVDPPALVSAPRGQLVEQSLQSGPRTLSVSARDVGSGIRAIVLTADGKPIMRWPASSTPCDAPYVRATPCATSIDSSVVFDTTQLENGSHELQVSVVDATNQNVGSSEPFLVAIDNPGRPGTVALLSATLGDGSGYKTFLRAPYGRGLTLSGRAANADGTVLANAALSVVTRIAGPGGAQVGAPATVTTDASGLYTLPVPIGPSRSFTAQYTDPSGRVVGAARALLEGPAPITLRAKRLGRDRFRLSGTAGGQPRPTSGVNVEIQARRGSVWQTFRSLRTDALGEFATSYPFLGSGRFRLRAIVREQNGYPFALGTSASVSVRVR